MAKNALDAAKSALGIQSPSRVFAAQVGAPIAQGMAQGIMAGAPAVASAAQTAAGAAVAGGQAAVQNTTSTRTVIYSPTYNRVSNTPQADRTIAAALAGV